MSLLHQDMLQEFQQVAAALDEYLRVSSHGLAPVITQPSAEALIEQLQLARHLAEGSLGGEPLGRFVGDYLAACTRLQHPGFLAHQVAVPHPNGALGSLIDGITNNAMAIYEMGPAASSVEYFMVNWMLQKVGWKTAAVASQADPASQHAGGVLTHGGSLANLTALLAARSARAPDFWQHGNPGNLLVLVPEQSHYSMQRSVAMLGIGAANCVAIASDADGRIAPDALALQVARLHQQGKRCMAIVANACGTAAGLYDPLEAIADICQEHQIWLHVDAAHGGCALVSNKLRPLMQGIERADSVVWDAHKMLSTPTVCAAVLVRQHQHLDQAFQTEASYLLHDKEQPGFDFISRTVECTKAGLGLRLFMAVASLGEAALEQQVDHLVKCARDAADLIEQQADFELAIQPEINIVCFRCGQSDQEQLEIRRQLLLRGNFYISSTLYRQQRWLRLVFMNPLTGLQQIGQLLEEIREIRKQLGSRGCPE